MSTPVFPNEPPGSASTGLPDDGQPGFARPSESLSDDGQPGFARPSESLSDDGQPGFARPSASLSELRQRDDLGETELGALWAAVENDTVAQKPTFRQKLRELPTAWRVTLTVFGAFVVAVIALGIGGVRLDMGAQTILRYTVAMLGFLVLTAAVFAVSLRGHHQKPLGTVALIVTGLAVLVPVVLAVMPWLWAPPPEMADAPISRNCLKLGITTGVIAGGIAWFFQRGDMNGWVRALSAAAGGGLVAFAMLQLHCPAHDATHLLVGHAGVGLFIVVVTAIVVAVRRRVS